MIVLDTHALVWYLDNPALLSPSARALVDRAFGQGGIHYSQISLWEIAMLAQKGRIRFTMPWEQWLERVEQTPFMTGVGVTAGIAARSVKLPASFPADPADRIIAATALELKFPLVTKDEAIRGAKVVKTIW